MFSNLRLLDSINRPKDLVNRAIELGLKGIAITDHECLSASMEMNLYQKEIQENNPDFKIALGNEIYLCDERTSHQRYYHFILIAKNAEGHKALRELSSDAWLNMYTANGMQRVVTLKSKLQEIISKYPNSLIGSTACLGGEVSACTKELIEAELIGDTETIKEKNNQIVTFILFCKELFGDDFYLECAPGRSVDQLAVNKRLQSIADCFDLKMVIGCDAHYLKKEDRYVHKAYLNSKGGEREVDMFYEFAYQQSEEEIIENLAGTGLNYEQMAENSIGIYDKIENYSLEHKQTIPLVEVKNYPKDCFLFDGSDYPTLSKLLNSDNVQERYWVQECVNMLRELNLDSNEIYWQRLEDEADVIDFIGNKLDDCLFSYFNTMKHYIDMFWEVGSIVGPGRGSATGFLSNFLLGITQLDPIKWGLPAFRFLNKERAELPDIDIDLAPSKRPAILKNIKEERGGELGLTLVATFGTESTKSTALTACRGYRSEECPDGIDSDTAQYLSSLVPSERGFVWPLSDVIYGNAEKDRKPIKQFVQEVKAYPGLLDIMVGIEGLINKRSSHASGVIMFDDDPYKMGCFMQTPHGEVITQYELHMCEAAGMTKYDFLLTEVSDKIIECFNLLKKDDIVKNETLKDFYQEYLHPQSIDINNQIIWDSLGAGTVLDCFQFSTDVGLMAAKKLKPQTPLEMTDANALMRLMSERGKESPIDKHARFKANIDLWYLEMSDYHLTDSEIDLLEPYYLKSYGTPPLQEQLMLILMDKGIANFSLAEANDARKIVAKKQMNRIPELKQKMFENMESPQFANYVWDTAIAPQLGYAFSLNHSLAYSYVGIQTIILATTFNPIYWDTACLQVNSGALDIENEKTADYGKIAKAVGDIMSKGIHVSLVDINKSEYSFKPDIENNQILFGMKALSGVGANLVTEIINNRPYDSMIDFMNKIHADKTAMISLVKSGAFDSLNKSQTRGQIMSEYIWLITDKKKRLTLQNFNGLMEHNMLPGELSFQQRVFTYNKYLKKYCKKGTYYLLMENYLQFYEEFFDADLLNIIDGVPCILQTSWDKIYKKVMQTASVWLKAHQEDTLKQYNMELFKEVWNKYADGNIAAWEMASLGFYYTEHELKDVNMDKYGIIGFYSLPIEPPVEYFFHKNGKDIPIYNTFKIIGTVIAKNDVKSSIVILSLDGVVNVKFNKDYYARFNRQISEAQEDGTKKVKEKSWFGRGNIVMVTGIRQGDQFRAKTYKNTPTHQLYKITAIEGSEIELTSSRYGEEDI